jgi:hypothetical protein
MVTLRSETRNQRGEIVQILTATLTLVVPRRVPPVITGCPKSGYPD